MEHSVHSYAFDDPAKNQKRTLAFVLVVAIHAMFIWVLNSGLGKAIVEFVAPPVETEILDEEIEDEEPPPPPPPDYVAPPPFVPPPDFQIAAPVTTGPTTAITTTTERPTVAPPPKPAPFRVRSRTARAPHWWAPASPSKERD